MRIVPAAVAAVLLAGLSPAWAQNPSADAIINALRPTGALKTGTRGIRPAAPSAPAAPDPAAQTVASQTGAARLPAAAAPSPAVPAVSRPAAAPAAAPSVNLTVQFASGSADLTPEAERTLDQLGQALSSPALASYRFRIEGHTDTVGARDANLALSQARAAKVSEYLAGKFGVSPSRLEPQGRGSQAPLVQTADQVAEPRNRRVQVINLGS